MYTANVSKGAPRSGSAGSGVEARLLLCELLRIFYDKGWISGTGGGICALISDNAMLLAPSAVHKERVRPQDFFVVDPGDGRLLKRPKDATLKPSECNSIFSAIIRDRGVGSVVHSHALSAVLAADLSAPEGGVVIEGFEMLKGIRGCSNQEVHRVPVINNAPKEPQLATSVEHVIRLPSFASSHCVLVRDHGAYIWGADVWEAKRHSEVYHFLFEGVIARTARKEVRV